ncbi:hydroxymethylglutaryl-CoA lyase [Kushneria pakistanensis]|uniref:Hydroxymethylglutaryl-CoA lyase n=1 Tax=Kushneria pakistanensis TaxID=1508770 RepID=A0ABQ3FHC6_9GAMM|nr:hydroxymethylglutaryl-CoA lyase [Kushneria pakistanensis]GHC24098.1 hydroxymethylglutaryl-CoA lyase [Kushneria pakistanensis]
MTQRIFIQEVAPRDGLQIEKRFVPTAEKIALIDALSRTGVAKIEATSFTSPKAIPNLVDAGDVMAGITRHETVDYVALVPNARGVERALAASADELNLVMSASDSHGLANLRMTPWQSLAHFPAMIEQTRGHDVFINASISTAFGCPFDGEVPASRVIDIVERLAALGIRGVSLCDTTGMANPAQVRALCNEVIRRWPDVALTLHVHNTRGMGLANVLAAWQAGVTRFDAALGGLGGCPFAPGASGNVCTEDMVHMFEEMGIDTGVDLDALLAVSATLSDLVGHEVPGQVVRAGRASRRYPLPEHMRQS